MFIFDQSVGMNVKALRPDSDMRFSKGTEGVLTPPLILGSLPQQTTNRFQAHDFRWSASHEEEKIFDSGSLNTYIPRYFFYHK